VSLTSQPYPSPPRSSPLTEAGPRGAGRASGRGRRVAGASSAMAQIIRRRLRTPGGAGEPAGHDRVCVGPPPREGAFPTPPRGRGLGLWPNGHLGGQNRLPDLPPPTSEHKLIWESIPHGRDFSTRPSKDVSLGGGLVYSCEGNRSRSSIGVRRGFLLCLRTSVSSCAAAFRSIAAVSSIRHPKYIQKSKQTKQSRCHLPPAVVTAHSRRAGEAAGVVGGLLGPVEGRPDEVHVRVEEVLPARDGARHI